MNVNQENHVSNQLNRSRSLAWMLKSKLTSLSGACLISAVLLAACSVGNVDTAAPDSNANLSTALTLEKTATVPVLDGKPTQTGVYIHNNTGQTISGIQYASVVKSNTSALQEQSANGQLQLGQNNCSTIAANSSCLLSFTTPSLSFGQSGSSLIDASYNGQHSKQLINYRYYSSNDYSGVNFSDGSSSLYGTNDYATVYAFVGKAQSQTKVGFNASNSSLVVSNGLSNGRVDIASNQVVALEIKSNTNVTSNLVNLTPYTVTSSKHLANSLQNASQQNQTLQVTISPMQQANLLMSDSPILNATGESTATITLINNGNQTATNISLTSADNAKVSVTAASSNPCTNGGSLVAGASCNYKLSLVDLYNNGSTSLNLAYNNNLTSVNTSQTVSYYNNLAAPMVSVVPTSSSFSEIINTTTTQTFNVQNIGNAPLSNLSVGLSNTLTQATLSQTNSCGATLNAQASCTITATVTANANVDSGIFYAKLSGDFTNGVTTSYSFVSKPVNTTITDPTIATISSTTPQTAATAVSVATGIALSFSKAMDPTTLNTTNIQLQKISDNSSVDLTFQGVSNGNQTVTFTQTSGTLSGLTEYAIVINPSGIKDYNGNAMGSSSTQQTASFTTVDSDIIAPTISSVNPSLNATNQSKTPTINISFSEPMNPATLTTSNITLKTMAGTAIAGTTITISNNDQTATLNLNGAQLLDNTTYQLVLNQINLTDVAGNALGMNTAYVATSFTTGDYTAPMLSSSIPLNGATGVAVESPISLTFSEAMDTTTLTTSTVQLQKISDSSYVTLNAPSFSNNNQTVTFQPTANLSAGDSYNLTIIPSSIKDVAGNAMNQATNQVVSTFTSPASITVSNTTSWSTMMGSAFAFTATITGGSSVVTPTATGITGNTISPTFCNLNSAVVGSESCVFIVQQYTGAITYYSYWDTANTTNSNIVATPTVVKTYTGINLSISATNGAIINGNSSPASFSGITGEVTAPYIYLPAIESGALSATNPTGITWGKTGNKVPIRFDATYVVCQAGQEIVSDKLTGLAWIKTPTSTKYTWANAQQAPAIPSTYCGYTDWRLPTARELSSLINYAAPSLYSWLNSQPFDNVNSGLYWSSTSYAPTTLAAWNMGTSSVGNISYSPKSNANYVWPVRGGQ